MGPHAGNSRRAYTIPQRRQRGGDEESEPRGLGDLDYGNWKLVLLYRAQGGFGSPTQEAPFRVTEVPKAEVDGFDEHLQSLVLGSESDSVAHIHLPKQLPLEEGAAEVLQWFSSTSQEQGAGDSPITDTGAQLALPSSLSPEERKRWHQIARTAGLYSSSSGLRENRRLVVHANAAESNEQWQRRDLKAQAQAREAHELLCEAHGDHSSYSISELEEMIVSGVDLPPEIRTQKTIKLAAAELWEALDAGKCKTAIKLLQATNFPRELACRRNAERSSYPMHAAVSGNMPEVALELANPSRYAGVFTQRDSSGKTALGLACATKQVDLVIAFMNAGARDAGGDIDGLHRTLIRTGDHTSRRVLNSSPYTTAFRRKKLNGARDTSNKAVQGELLRPGTGAKQNTQSRRDGTAQRGNGSFKEQEHDSSPSAGTSVDEHSNGQVEVPKEASRRRLAATGVNSLRALLQQNAVALASSPSPSSKMAASEEHQQTLKQHTKQVEPPAPRVRRGRGRFQGSEEASAGIAPEPAMRTSVRESRAAAQEPVSNESTYAAAPHLSTQTADRAAQSHAPGNSTGAGYHEIQQDDWQVQVAPEQPDWSQGHMPSIPEQHVPVVSGAQQPAGVQYVTAGMEGLMHQGPPTIAGVPVTDARTCPQYSIPTQPQYISVAPTHTQPAVNAQSQPQSAGGKYTYVTTSGAASTAAPRTPAGQAPGQVMYVLVTGSDGGQYLLPVQAQVA